MQTRTARAVSRQTGVSFVTSIPGRSVNPAKLASYLDQRFVNDYTVQVCHRPTISLSA
jgi:hypothetical protein